MGLWLWLCLWLASQKDFKHIQKDFLINVWGYANLGLRFVIALSRSRGAMAGRKTSDTSDPEIQATRNTSYLTASKSLNGRKIARMAPILTIFGPNRSQRRNLFFEKISNERRRHRGIVVVVVIVAVVVAAVAVVGDFR